MTHRLSQVGSSSETATARPFTTGVPVPADIEVEPSAWVSVLSSQCDALLTGDDRGVLRVLTFIWPALRKPVYWPERGSLLLPLAGDGTVIVEGIHQMGVVDQERLLDWLRHRAPLLRLIATASDQLRSLVDSGSFSSRLYDRVKGVELVIP